MKHKTSEPVWEWFFKGLNVVCSETERARMQRIQANTSCDLPGWGNTFFTEKKDGAEEMPGYGQRVGAGRRMQ
jgi:hypothetical protein